MSSAVQPLTRIQTRGHRKRRVADALIKAHQSPTTLTPCASSTSKTIVKTAAQTTSSSSIRIVCISDTHNTQPSLPDGDVLIHAGDLTDNGSFEEMQKGLTWLSSQSHRYKVFIAGNHDVLLDDAFLAKYPERRYGQSKTRHDLDWGNVIYLQDSAITLKFSGVRQKRDTGTQEADNPHVRNRSLTIFGSPWTPQYGISAFQYHPHNSEHWEELFASSNHSPQILITHGPPRHHLDRRDFHRAGCPYLAEEIRRIQPRLHVFGHIHASYGREDVILDSVRRSYEEVMTGWAGWGSLLWMAISLAWARVKRVFWRPGSDKVTTFVNASAVGGPHNELRNAPVVVDV